MQTSAIWELFHVMFRTAKIGLVCSISPFLKMSGFETKEFGVRGLKSQIPNPELLRLDPRIWKGSTPRQKFPSSFCLLKFALRSRRGIIHCFGSYLKRPEERFARGNDKLMAYFRRTVLALYDRIVWPRHFISSQLSPSFGSHKSPTIFLPFSP